MNRFTMDKDPQWAGTTLELYDGRDALDECRFLVEVQWPLYGLCKTRGGRH